MTGIPQENALLLRNHINTFLKLKCSIKNQPELQLDVKDLNYALKTASVPIKSDLVPKLLNVNFDDAKITSICTSGNLCIFTLNENDFLKETLNDRTSHKLFDEPSENIIVEFSSPNIAKPFHVGHLRSTIIGNFIANVLEAYDHNVTRINYLGDWGTQFGYLKLGMDMAAHTEQEIQSNPIKHLFNAYVNANRLAETDSTFSEKARNIFRQMENGELHDLQAWTKYREYTTNELEHVYKRLGIEFDEYAWESQYRKTNILPLLNKMNDLGILVTESDGKQSFELDDGKRISLLKSDGSTLYLTRDVAAIVDRQQKYNFDRMCYVVGNDQYHHFNALFNIARRMEFKNCHRLQHIKFGRIEKMSTRKGNVVFLSDILDDVKELMWERQSTSMSKCNKTEIRLPFSSSKISHFLSATKIDTENDQHTADILGVSALIVHELQRSRMRNYSFDTKQLVQEVNAKGRNFQYTHSRLCSLEEKIKISLKAECDPMYLKDPEALQLAIAIGRFPEILYHAKDQLESQNLLTYMFFLNTKISKALKSLNIKNEPDKDLQLQRMLLFAIARKTLASCMKIIGLVPLKKM